MKGRRRGAAVAKADPRRRSFRLGVNLYLGIALLLTGLAFKPQIISFLTSGDTIKAEFSSSYKLRAHDSSVKLAGLVIGQVTGIDYTDHHTAIVTMKIDKSDRSKLGSRPTASIEERTLLGGRYSVDLHPAGTGAFDGSIPLARTTTPVEVDKVLEALPSTAREALKQLVGETSPVLKASTPSLQRLLATAPGVLRPGSLVVAAVRGEHPQTDIAQLVTNLEKTAGVLTAKDGQLDAIARDLSTTSAALAAHRTALTATLADLPATARQARIGLAGLTDSITELRTTAADLRPTAPRLDTLIAELQPALTHLQPVLRDLRPTLEDARPAVQQLVPVAKGATGILGDLHGPVLDRVNGPIASFVLNPWKGTGPYADGASGYLGNQKFYEELAYMATNIDRASMAQDARGSTLVFQAGAGFDSVDGLPFNLPNLVDLALKEFGVTSPALHKLALNRALELSR